MTTLRGTMLTPGVSANGRLYTPDLIQKAYKRLAERIKDGTSPATMLTHHDAKDDSVRIVGKISGVSLDGDNLNYTAELANTDHAKTIESLVSGKFLQNVSIRGFWLGPVQNKTYNGESVTTADDLEIDGLDFTKTPGVAGATVTTSESAAIETGERVLITEAATARVAFTETVEPVFADLGYLARVKRYPLTTAHETQMSWARINETSNATAYTPAQLKRVRGRIKAALKKHGADMIETATADEVIETETRLSDITECYMDGTGTAGFSISAYNGPLTVSVSTYNGIEPADLSAVAQAAMAAACGAIAAMDPDTDGDIDTGTSEDDSDESDDNNMESKTSAAPAEHNATLVAETEGGSDVADATETTEAAAVEAAAESAAVESNDADAPITRAMLDAAVAAAVAAATAPAAVEGETPAETADASDLTETAAATPIDEAAMRASIRDELIAEMKRSGVLGRKGLVEALEAPEKPMHEMSDEEFRAQSAKVWNATMPGLRD